MESVVLTEKYFDRVQNQKGDYVGIDLSQAEKAANKISDSWFWGSIDYPTEATKTYSWTRDPKDRLFCILFETKEQANKFRREFK